MTRLPSILLIFSTLAFCLSTFYSVRYLRRQRNDDGFWANASAFGGYISFTLGGLVRVALAGFFPYGSFADALLVMVWIMMSAYILVQLRWNMRSLGVFCFPVAVLASAYALTLPVAGAAALPILRSPWVVFHVSMVLAGYAAFALAALLGTLYLMQERRLKAKQLAFMHFQLPDLVTLDRLSVVLVKIGFPLLTIGILSGSYWSRQVWGSYLPDDPKLIWAMLNWCYFAAYLIVSRACGIGGRKQALAITTGFATIVVNYFGASFLLDGLHRFF